MLASTWKDKWYEYESSNMSEFTADLINHTQKSCSKVQNNPVYDFKTLILLLEPAKQKSGINSSTVHLHPGAYYIYKVYAPLTWLKKDSNCQ